MCLPGLVQQQPAAAAVAPCRLPRPVRPLPCMQLALLRSRWPTILGCLMLQYCHGVFTQLAYRMHRPATESLHDLGFSILPVSIRCCSLWQHAACGTACMQSLFVPGSTHSMHAEPVCPQQHAQHACRATPQ